jgi:exopolysaccharide biosynthesis polyprenyl glycosylphosphotransferase
LTERLYPQATATEWLDSSGRPTNVVDQSYDPHQRRRPMTATLTSSFRREAFASNAAAARSARASKTSYVRLVAAVDLTAVGVAVAVGYLARFQLAPTGTDVPYLPVGVALVVVWFAVLGLTRAYDERVLGYGGDEYRRVVGATVKLAGAVAIVGYLTMDLHDYARVARGFLGLSFGTGVLLLPVGRWLARRVQHRARSRGSGWSRRVLVVGDAPHVIELTHQLRREWYAGYTVVGACIPEALVAPVPQQLDGVPVVGSFRNILDAAATVCADTVAVTGAAELTASRLRRLGWQMEGTGVDLVLAPALTDVAGPRIHTRPVAGLPLIHVESPEFRGARKALKGAFDRTCAFFGLLLLSPVYLTIALAIKVDSKGPVLFRQTRVGMDGREFAVFKFRSMVVDADRMLRVLTEHNETDGLMFKMRNDPRVTSVGALLRKWSLDELPQLMNVLLGHMSLVGPRPPLPTEVAWYDQDIARRLLVKPGMTGLWQVSGRSDLSWEDGIRLDLYYVENWSLATDISILWKTVGAVVRGRGAY